MTSTIKKVSSKAQEKIMSIDEVRKITESGKSSFDERSKKAFQMAFDEIIRNSAKKIKEAAEKGSSRAKLYTWKYTEDPKDPKYTFNGFKCSLVFFKFKQNDKAFKDVLLDHFNKDNKGDQYRIYFYRDEKTEERSLCIAWGKQREQETAESENTTE